MYKHGHIYKGIFKVQGVKIKVEAEVKEDFDGDPFIDTWIYKFRKGRYEFMRYNCHNICVDTEVVDINIAVTYIIKK
jgi:hypothetical protein